MEKPTKYADPPSTPPATPYPTPTPAATYYPETTEQPKPYVSSVDGIPVFDASSMIATDEMGKGPMMSKKLIFVEARLMNQRASFKQPDMLKSQGKDQMKGLRLFMKNAALLPTAMVNGKMYYLVNKQVANALGASAGQMEVPMNDFGDMFSPKPYKPLGREQMVGTGDTHGFLYFIVAIIFIFIAASISRNNR